MALGLKTVMHIKQQPDSVTLISFYFHPGWNRDLTSWSIDVLETGVICQTVYWYEEVHGKGEEQQEEVILSAQEKKEFEELFIQLVRGDLGELSGSTTDDAPNLTIRIPKEELKFDLDDDLLFHQVFKGKLKLDIAKSSSDKAAGALWKFVDSHSILSIKNHFA